MHNWCGEADHRIDECSRSEVLASSVARFLGISVDRLSYMSPMLLGSKFCQSIALMPWISRARDVGLRILVLLSTNIALTVSLGDSAANLDCVFEG